MVRGLEHMLCADRLRHLGLLGMVKNPEIPYYGFQYLKGT